MSHCKCLNCTEQCRFLDKRLREISRFLVAPPRVFPLSVRARVRESTPHFIHKYLHLSIPVLKKCCAKIPSSHPALPSCNRASSANQIILRRRPFATEIRLRDAERVSRPRLHSPSVCHGIGCVTDFCHTLKKPDLITLIRKSNKTFTTSLEGYS